MSLDSSLSPRDSINEETPRPKVVIEANKTSVKEAVQKLLNQSTNKKINDAKFKGICLQVLSPEQTQRLTLSNTNAYTRTIKTNDKINSRMRACRVYIPSLHGDRALPNDIFNPSIEDKNRIEFFFPIFMSETEEIAKKPIKPGDIVHVQIKNRMGGGIYTGTTNEGNSSLTIWKALRSSAAKFKCDIIRTKKITNVKGAVVSSGTTIISSEGKKGVSDDALNQQYIKYLYEKEKAHLAELNAYWTKGKLGSSLEKALADIGEGDNGKDLIWRLIDKMSGFKPVGLSIVTNTPIIDISSVNNDYGIFKISKQLFDRYVLDLENGETPAEGSVDEEINLSQHSDLLDPDFSIRFFVSDFKKYLTVNGTDFQKVSGPGLTEDNKKIIAKYFTANPDKINSIFTNDFDSVAFFSTSGVEDKPKLNKLPEFKEWLSEATGGQAVNIDDFINDTTGKKDNKQTLDVEKPKNTPDECHDSYPHYNDYLIYVDTQKKAMRDYIDSPISGRELNFLRNEHRGENNVIFSGVKVRTPFKVVRFDGTTGLGKDPQRWRDLQNTSGAIFDKNFIKGYFRPKKYISKIICSSMMLDKDSDKYYKNSLKILTGLNNSLPHFIISDDGQIIQLVDFAMANNLKIPNSKISINISFASGVGDKLNITGENTVSLNNYILVKTEKKENTFRPHKIASKASLEAMQELILFLTSFLGMKYNLAAQPFKLEGQEMNKSTIQAMGHHKGISGMDFIYYAWTYGTAYKVGGRNILSKEYGFG